MNIQLFIAYRIVSRMYFHLPILFLLFWALGITYSMATMLLAAYSAASTLSGDFAHLLSARMSSARIVLMGEAMKAGGLILIIVGTWAGDVSLICLFLGQWLGGTGFSLALSADGGVLRSAASGADAKMLGAMQARIQSWMFIATLFAGFIGGILYDHEANFALYAGISATIVSMLLVYMLDERPALGDARPATSTTSVTDRQAVQQPLILSRDQMTWVGFYSVTRAFALAPFIGLLPLYFAMQQVDPYLFGLVLGLFTLGGFLVALYGGPLLARWGFKGTWVSLGGIIMSLGIFSVSNMLEKQGIPYFYSSLVGITLLGIAAGAIRPSVMSCLDINNLSPTQRMQVFGLMERIFGYLCASLLIAFGWLVESFSVTRTFEFCVGALIVTLVAGCVWLRTRYPMTRDH